MYCAKCGTSNPDGASFCKNCGAPLIVVPSKEASTSFSNPTKSTDRKNRMIGVAAVALVSIVVIVVVFSIVGGRYESVVNKFMDSMFDGNLKQALSYYPDKVIEYEMDRLGYGERELVDFIKDHGENLSVFFDQMKNFGVKYEITHKITGATDYSTSELNELNKTYEKYGLDVKAAKKVSVLLHVNAFGIEESHPFSLTVVKIKNHWYIDYNYGFTDIL